MGRSDDRVEALLRRYGGHGSGRSSAWGLTPQMAFRLIVAAEDTFDGACEHPGVFVDEGMLPPSVLAAADDVFISRFLSCFSDLAERLEAAESRCAPRRYLAHCVGEEVALAHVIQVAADWHADGWFDDAHRDELARLATNSERDRDFDWYADTLFEDRDFEVLWMPHLDGVEGDDRFAHVRFVNLHRSRWFLPFPAA